MCGIAGFINSENLNETHLQNTEKLLKHRGPDGFSFQHQGHIGFSHTRLAIQDKSIHSQQPFLDKESGSLLTFNGEIYNYIELRDEIIKENKNIHFKSEGDSEVLFKGLQLFGIEFVNKLNGDFSFCYYEGKSKLSYLVRDRLGVKPLYYSTKGECVYFSSEVRALSAFDLEVKVNDSFLNSFLALRYSRGEKTAYQNIYTVPPAHWLVINENGVIDKVEYWSPLVNLEKDNSKINLNELFENAVKIRTRSKEPIGCLLSGGVDSSLVASNVKKVNIPLETYTCEFQDSKSSKGDVSQAKITAKKLGFNSTIYQHNKNYIKDAINAIEEPIGDAIISPLFGLIKKSSETSKVLLTGEGADEVFGGYAHHYFIPMAAKFKFPLNKVISKILGLGGVPLLKLFKSIYPSELTEEELNRIKKAFQNNFSVAIMYHNICDIFTLEERKLLIGKKASCLILETEKILEPVKLLSPIKQLIYLELKTWLPNYNLLKLDKITGHFGMEGRVPFLDHRIIEYLFASEDKEVWDVFKRKPMVMGLVKINPKVSKRKKIPFTYLGFEKKVRFINKLTNMKSNKPIDLKNAVKILSNSSQGLLGLKKMNSINILLEWFTHKS